MSHENVPNRRRFLKNSAAIGAAAALTGCNLANGQSPTTGQVSQLEKTASDYAVYIVEPTTEYFRTGKTPVVAEPIHVSCGTGGGARTNATELPKRPFQYLAWANQGQAQELIAEPTIKAVDRLTVSTMYVVGEPESAKGVLAVRLFPAGQHRTVKAGTYQTVASVADEWQKAFGNESVSFEPVVSDRTGHAYGNLPEAGQILVKFKTDALDAKLLAAIKTHPQTVALRWGDIFKIFYCPGCGLG